MNDIRVLMITPDYPPDIVGGCAISCNLLVEGLRSRGIRTDVFAFNGHPGHVESEMGFTKYFWTSKTLLGLNTKTLKELNAMNEDYDIIHVYNTQQLPAAVYYAKRKGIKVVATLNNIAPICTNPSAYDGKECAECLPLDSLRCSMQRRGSLTMRLWMPMHWTQFITLHQLSKQVDSYIVLSESTRECYTNAGFDTSRLNLIPNMYDPKIKAETEVSSKEKGAKGVNIVYVGRLEVEKGLQTLIEAISLMDRDDITLYIVGKGGYEEELRELCRDMNLEDRVVFTGFVPQERVSKYYRMADVFVHPALWPEPFPRTILEALAHRSPILVSDSGASPKVLENACSVFRTGDAIDLALKLRSVLFDDAVRSELISNGPRILESYSPDTVISKVLNVYDSVLGKDDV